MTVQKNTGCSVCAIMSVSLLKGGNRMAAFNEKEYNIMEDVIDGMKYKPFVHSDMYYPSEQDIDRLGTETENGKEYSKDEIRYLHWLVQFPQKDRYPVYALPVRKKILDILADIDLIEISEEEAEKEREEAMKILKELKENS